MSTVTDYASLETAVQDYLTRSDLTDANFLPEILQMGQDRIFKGFTDNKGNYYPGLRVRQMQKTFGGGGINAFTLVGGSSYAAADTIAATAAPAGGVTATGVLTVTAGVITAFTLTNPGAGYTTAPTWTITTSTGTGGSVTCTIAVQPTISPSGNLAVPADYIELGFMTVITANGPYRLERKEAEWIYKYYGANSGQGVPNYVGRDGGVFIFAPTADSGYTLGGRYLAVPAYLSASNTTNFLTTTYPALLLAACLAEATAFVRDWTANAQWEGRFATLVNSVRMADRDEK